jgi:hypothetical protein
VVLLMVMVSEVVAVAEQFHSPANILHVDCHCSCENERYRVSFDCHGNHDGGPPENVYH